MDQHEAAIQDRVHSLLEQKIAMGGGLPDWVEFVKMVQSETGLPYKRSMELASPLWREMRHKGSVIRAPPRRGRGEGVLAGDGVLAGVSAYGDGVLAGVSAYGDGAMAGEGALAEMLGAGFSRQEIVAAASKVLPVIHKLVGHLIPHIADEADQSHLNELLDVAAVKLAEHLGSGARSVSRKRSHSRGGARPPSRQPSRSRSRGGARSSSRQPSRSRSRGGARPSSRQPSRSRSRGGARPSSRQPSRSRSRGGARPSSRQPSRSRSRGGARPASRPRPRPASKGRGGARPASRPRSRPASRGRGGASKASKLSRYHTELAKYKAQHPTMTHMQAVKSFKKVYRR